MKELHELFYVIYSPDAFRLTQFLPNFDEMLHMLKAF